MTTFGAYLRGLREARGFSIRSLAKAAGVNPSHLLQVEMGKKQFSEDPLCKLAQALGEDVDVMLAASGKLSPRLMAIIRKRPRVFAQLISHLEDAPDHAILRVVREVRDGKW